MRPSVPYGSSARVVINGYSATKPAFLRTRRKVTWRGARVSEATWRFGEGESSEPLSGEVNIQKLKAAQDAAFIESDPEKKKMTRAVVVVYDGKLIGERYAPGFEKNTPLLGWSMSKSVTNALVGVLVRQGKLRIREPTPVAEWQKAGDSRKSITLDQLLRMSSGLKSESH